MIAAPFRNPSPSRRFDGGPSSMIPLSRSSPSCPRRVRSRRRGRVHNRTLVRQPPFYNGCIEDTGRLEEADRGRGRRRGAVHLRLRPRRSRAVEIFADLSIEELLNVIVTSVSKKEEVLFDRRPRSSR